MHEIMVNSGEEKKSNAVNGGDAKVFIMKRPTQQHEKASSEDKNKQSLPVKTLEQRQAEYKQARLRILGNAGTDELDGPLSSANSSETNSNSIDSSDASSSDISSQTLQNGSENPNSICNGKSAADKNDNVNFVTNGNQRGIIKAPVATLDNIRATHCSKPSSSHQTSSKQTQQLKQNSDTSNSNTDLPSTSAAPSETQQQHQLISQLQNLRLAKNQEQRLWSPSRNQKELNTKKKPSNRHSLGRTSPSNPAIHPVLYDPKSCDITKQPAAYYDKPPRNNADPSTPIVFYPFTPLNTPASMDSNSHVPCVSPDGQHYIFPSACPPSYVPHFGSPYYVPCPPVNGEEPPLYPLPMPFSYYQKTPPPPLPPQYLSGAANQHTRFVTSTQSSPNQVAEPGPVTPASQTSPSDSGRTSREVEGSSPR